MDATASLLREVAERLGAKHGAKRTRVATDPGRGHAIIRKDEGSRMKDERNVADAFDVELQQIINALDDGIRPAIEALEEELRPYLETVDEDLRQYADALDEELRPILEAWEESLKPILEAMDAALAGWSDGGGPDEPAGKNSRPRSSGDDRPKRSGSG
jgi:hypothetical protein